MNKYYKPTEEELVVGLPIEWYIEGAWHPHVIEHYPKWYEILKDGDIRVKYLNSDDFNSLGYIVKKTFLGKQTYIIDILEDDSEVTEERDVFNEEILTIIKGGVPQGKFLPYAPNKDFSYNVEYEGKKHIIKNLLELRKILK